MPERIHLLRKVIEDSPRQIGDIKLPVIPSRWDPRDYRYERLLYTADLQPLPRKTNYRANLPPIYKQKFGTCTAASTCWGMKAFQEISQGDFPAEGLSVAFLYAIEKNLDGMPNQPGSQPRYTFEALQKYGVCPAAIYPDDVLTSDVNVPMPPVTAIKAAAQYRIQTYAQLASPTDNDLQARVNIIRQAIAREGPIEAAILVVDNFMDINGPDYIIPEPKGYLLGGHMVCLCDYDDDKQAFLLRNTWGKEWGNEGYAWLPYHWLTLTFDPIGDGQHYVPYFMEAWTATDITVPRAASRIEIIPGADTMLVDGQAVRLDQPAFVTQDTNRLMLPLRAVAGNMGYLVQWDGQKAILTKPN
ncbi:MAG: stalk domain-containing protein [Moorellaceae bacterium]